MAIIYLWYANPVLVAVVDSLKRRHKESKSARSMASVTGNNARSMASVTGRC